VGVFEEFKWRHLLVGGFKDSRPEHSNNFPQVCRPATLLFVQPLGDSFSAVHICVIIPSFCCFPPLACQSTGLACNLTELLSAHQTNVQYNFHCAAGSLGAPSVQPVTSNFALNCLLCSEVQKKIGGYWRWYNA
jgi:hypothetical protein